jgi:hypothetical protein
MHAVLNTDRWNIEQRYAAIRSRIWDVIDDDGSRICQVVIKPNQHRGTVQMGREGQLTFRDEVACAMAAHKALLDMDSVNATILDIQKQTQALIERLNAHIEDENINLDLALGLNELRHRLANAFDGAETLRQEWN